MIPLRYRERMPPYWYENRVAAYFFEAAGGESQGQKEKILELGKQWLLPYATYSFGVWDWLFFGDNQVGTIEQRRLNIKKKLLAKAQFTKTTLMMMAQEAGKLLGIEEDYRNKEILFTFTTSEPIQLSSFLESFEKIRPVHVKRAGTVAGTSVEPIQVQTTFRTSQVDYLSCGTFFCGNDYPEQGEGSTKFVFLQPNQLIFVTSKGE
ncbi:UNVERIFIED_CONTAM: hypothetical protein ABID98_000945 [Brevibacillus sp. OAP136]